MVRKKPLLRTWSIAWLSAPENEGNENMVNDIVNIIEPDDDARINFARILESQGINTRAYASVDSFMQAFDPGQRSVLLLELVGSGTSGLKLLRRLHRERLSMAVVATTAADSPRLVLDAFHAGAFDCLLKPVDSERLLGCLSRAQAESRRRYERIAFCRVVRGGLAALSQGEADVLESLLVGMANKKTAIKLKVGLRTVEARRARIMRKLDSANLPELVRKVVLYRAAEAEISLAVHENGHS